MLEEFNFVTPIYGTDKSRSIQDNSVDEWNTACLNTVLDVVEEWGISVEYVNTPYLYFGMWKAIFAQHAKYMCFFIALIISTLESPRLGMRYPWTLGNNLKD